MLLDANAMLLALHAPDGLFSLPVNLLFAAAVVLLLAAAVVQLRRGQDHRLVPVMGIMAAFVFAGQMVNFPVAAGTTGHLLGGVLAAVLLGPWAASLVLATVVFFQALLGDGGLTAPRKKPDRAERSGEFLMQSPEGSRSCSTRPRHAPATKTT